MQDPKLLAALVENRKRSVAYAGAFLLKDDPGTDSSHPSGSETEKSIHDLKGKELFKRLHEVGTLAQVNSYIYQLRMYQVAYSFTDILVALYFYK